MAIRQETPDQRVVCTGSIYLAQRRPMHDHIIINDVYQGIRVIAPWQAEDVLRVPFTPQFGKSGVIDAWCCRADGETVLVMNEESRTASWLSLAPLAESYDLTAPPASDVHALFDIRYLWERESFWMLIGKSHRFYTLDSREGVPILIPGKALRARVMYPMWCRALDAVKIQQCNVLRVVPDQHYMLYHDFSTRPGRIGMINWRSGGTWTSPAPQDVPRLTFLEGRMFVLHEHEVHAINEAGEIEVVYAAPRGFHYHDLDVLPAQNGHPAALVLACNSLDLRDSQLQIFGLT